jgi:hypothetical protein
MSKSNQLPEQLIDALQEKDETAFPVGTLAYYGPDDETVTKIKVSVVSSSGAVLVSRYWRAENLDEDPEVVAEIGEFLRSQGAKEVIMTHGIVGCAHVEGVDYPAGKQCPHCPFWQNKT